MHLKLDEDDAATIHKAIALRQSFRVLPDSESDTAGTVLAEICRDWLEYKDRVASKRDDDQEGEEWRNGNG